MQMLLSGTQTFLKVLLSFKAQSLGNLGDFVTVFCRLYCLKITEMRNDTRTYTRVTNLGLLLLPHHFRGELRHTSIADQMVVRVGSRSSPLSPLHFYPGNIFHKRIDSSRIHHELFHPVLHHLPDVHMARAMRSTGVRVRDW